MNAADHEHARRAVATFKAIVIEKAEGGTKAALTDFDEANLMDGDVTVRVEYSTVNYKDGLAITGKAPVVRRFPMIAGIDFAGTVENRPPSGLEAGRQGHPQRLGLRRDPSRRLCAKRRGSRATGWCRCREHERARGDGDRHRRLHRHAGGDGAGAPRPDAASAAGRGDRRGRRRRLGRHRDARQARLSRSSRSPAGRRRPTISRASAPPRSSTARNCRPAASRSPRSVGPGAIDAVGSTTLANLLSMTRYGGAVAACGLAGGMDLPASVAPFILRGVCLYGINSVMCPLPTPAGGVEKAGNRPGPPKTGHDDPRNRSFRRCPEAAAAILAGQVRGRIVVKIG